jgi:hypothetical protein
MEVNPDWRPASRQIANGFVMPSQPPDWRPEWGSHDEVDFDGDGREEPYWFDVEPPDPQQNAGYLGTIKSWARQRDRWKLRGLYVDLDKSGNVRAPTDITDEATLREVIAHVHQIGWQLRLGEHIEGKRQDELDAGSPPLAEEDLSWFDTCDDSCGDVADILKELRRSMREGIPGQPLPNAAYRFNPPGADRSPFRNIGKPGYEAETREIILLADEVVRREDELVPGRWL